MSRRRRRCAARKYAAWPGNPWPTGPRSRTSCPRPSCWHAAQVTRRARHLSAVGSFLSLSGSRLGPGQAHLVHDDISVRACRGHEGIEVDGAGLQLACERRAAPRVGVELSVCLVNDHTSRRGCGTLHRGPRARDHGQHHVRLREGCTRGTAGRGGPGAVPVRRQTKRTAACDLKL